MTTWTKPLPEGTAAPCPVATAMRAAISAGFSRADSSIVQYAGEMLFGTLTPMLDQFFLSHPQIRNKQTGGVVSIREAGANLAGDGAGPVRTGLITLDAQKAHRLPR